MNNSLCGVWKSQLAIDIPHDSSANPRAFGAQAKRDAEKTEQEKQKASERKDGKSERRASSYSKHSRSPVKDRDRKSRCANCQNGFSPCMADGAAGLSSMGAGMFTMQRVSGAGTV